MTREEAVKLALECFRAPPYGVDGIAERILLAVKQEREACALIADKERDARMTDHPFGLHSGGGAVAAVQIGYRIRSRGLT